ncbi:MAG: UDP-N-acetylmuramoyl-tripeptide--D-alanyl-D-alanine ligase [Oscillospiraceae bacterium]|jgi:UDP-N-acetylmuramoyl-tripeptide--D-alanyl-D-alanine ligase|nr:UDP-N-acetylmuramoyl-tripeptide--D-alanyl-D-alanine ligase [Oscillospiraceae bacterium]
MKPLDLQTIAAVTGGRYVGDASRLGERITGVVRDSHEAYDGCLFLCIKGERADGHSFANSAFAGGAICALAERELDEPTAPYILVESTLAALMTLGEYYRSLLDIPVVGVTGSVGKTTAKEMIAAVLSARYNVLKTSENLNNEIGVPLTLLSIHEEHTAAVVEMGISDFGEMRRLSKMARPTVCVMTAIGYCHLDNLGDPDGVLRAKAEVFEYMPSDGVAVLNGDDERLYAYDPQIPKITFGFSAHNAYRAENLISRGTEGVEFDIVTETERFAAAIPAYGEHLALAALAAAAVGNLLGLTADEITRGLLSYAPVGGRANVTDTGYITVIDDCYNANPHSVKAALRSLRGLKGRRVAILGDMLELGGGSAELHREIGAYAAEQGVNCLICHGERAEFIFKGLIASKSEIERYHFPLRDALMERLPGIIRAGDVVLVKASHSMRFDEIVELLKSLG